MYFLPLVAEAQPVAEQGRKKSFREEDLSLTTAAIAGLGVSAVSDDDDDAEHNDHPVLSAASLAAAARSTSRPPSLQTLLEDVPDSAAVPHTSSSGGDSDGKSRSNSLGDCLKKLTMNLHFDVGREILHIPTFSFSSFLASLSSLQLTRGDDLICFALPQYPFPQIEKRS
ncbi:uncharacterized protein LOC132181781 [Corylus avellana]|uniref:uncharacterized protein LOC132181781 n=1 Tax=Corylus avellana TaxID=13451 RepID=UPI00286B00A0|nr:uncharacterized protein LOC132181781 [Corylus avellana]